ncbi:MAG: hypothetical protein HZC40_11465 [Chloroflexi bacterium]|nr:hypothetical protein [Chloroflexota bacterium]
MASALTKKRARVARIPKRATQRVGEMTLGELNTLIQTMIDRRLTQPPITRAKNKRARLVDLARRAEGNWKKTEPQGTAVEVVRKLREEW